MGAKSMKNKWTEKYQNSSLVSKIRLSYYMILIPTFIFVGVWISYVWGYNQQYDRLIGNATAASEFSIDFKKDFDQKIYLIIVGNQTFENADPYDDISQAKRIVSDLKNATTSEKNIARLVRIERCLKNLEKYTGEIEENVKTVGNYDENIEIWNLDISGVTALIQEYMMEFLYYQTKEIETVREGMEAQSMQWLLISIMFLGAIAIGTTVLSALIPKSITRPIRHLCKVTEAVSRGNLEVRSNIKHGVEVKKLGDSLDVMIKRLHDSMEAVKMEQKNLREAELELLQMQINPHFLYNTLDTIVWLAEAGKQKEVVNMVEALSEFFRTSLNQGNDIITIKEECLHATRYLQIQQIRYQDILAYEIQVPSEIENYLIPKITLQPFIENALYHGIKNKRGGGKIVLEGEKLGNKFVIRVKDNGIGMTPERLAIVNRGIRKEGTEEKDFYGLYNVNQRIILRFGNEFGIRLESQYNVGTMVEVLLPCTEILPERFSSQKNEIVP